MPFFRREDLICTENGSESCDLFARYYMEFRSETGRRLVARRHQYACTGIALRVCCLAE
jgi:hypothetical protein